MDQITACQIKQKALKRRLEPLKELQQAKCEAKLCGVIKLMPIQSNTFLQIADANSQRKRRWLEVSSRYHTKHKVTRSPYHYNLSMTNPFL